MHGTRITLDGVSLVGLLLLIPLGLGPIIWLLLTSRNHKNTKKKTKE
jgi:hypothetical protein